MYWFFSFLFIIAVMIPDIVRKNISFLPEERAEEIIIFSLGTIAFLTFLRNERRIAAQRKEKEKAQKKMNQTVKDLVDSYSYIGEVNRKMDILMEVALGLADRSLLDKKKEKEVYESIINAANFLLKGDSTTLRFINMETQRTERELKIPENTNMRVSNKELIGMPENVNIKKQEDYLIISSPQKINQIKSFLVVNNYDDQEEKKPRNIEILKLFASQAVFLHAYMEKGEDRNCECEENKIAN